MTGFRILLAASCLALASCGGSETDGADTGAEDFAARINGGADRAPAPAGTVAPTKVAPLPNAAEGAFSPGTATDPQSATCGANVMGPWIGEMADAETRQAIVEAAGDNRNVRFVAHGSDYIKPDASSPRLNLMLDASGIIRDARCG